VGLIEDKKVLKMVEQEKVGKGDGLLKMIPSWCSEKKASFYPCCDSLRNISEPEKCHFLRTLY
jgi:hypothetical protein